MNEIVYIFQTIFFLVLSEIAMLIGYFVFLFVLLCLENSLFTELLILLKSKDLCKEIAFNEL